MRFFLGLGEAGNFPASIKTVAEWFPQRERALTVGIFNAGSYVGAIIAPPILAFHALPVILIISALSKLAYHWGLLQPLVVTRNPADPERYEVEAGGRRLRAPMLFLALSWFALIDRL